MTYEDVTPFSHPNQGLLHVETEMFWQQYGQIHTVDNGGIFLEAHTFKNFMDTNPVIENRLVTKRGPEEEYLEYNWVGKEGETAPNPLNYVKQWMNDGQTDYVFVCHSQGCNIATRLLNKVCTQSN